MSEWNDATFEERQDLRRQATAHLLSMYGNDSASSALARAVLANPDDRVTIGVLMDACQEWLEHEPDAARESERVAAAVRAAKGGGQSDDWHIGEPIYHPAIIPLLDKLRDLGYGDAVDEYLRPSGTRLFNNGVYVGTVRPVIGTEAGVE